MRYTSTLPLSEGLFPLLHCLLSVALKPLAQLHGVLRRHHQGRLNLTGQFSTADLPTLLSEVHLPVLVDLMAHVVRNAGALDVKIGDDRSTIGGWAPVCTGRRKSPDVIGVLVDERHFIWGVIRHGTGVDR